MLQNVPEVLLESQVTKPGRIEYRYTIAGGITTSLFIEVKLREFKTTADDKTPRFTLEVFDNGAKSTPVTGSSEWTYNFRKAVLEIRVA